MAIFLVERELAEAFDPTDDMIRAVDSYEDEHDIAWVTSFLSADKKKTYCLYECDDIEMLRKHAADLGLPANAITEVNELQR